MEDKLLEQVLSGECGFINDFEQFRVQFRKNFTGDWAEGATQLEGYVAYLRYLVEKPEGRTRDILLATLPPYQWNHHEFHTAAVRLTTFGSSIPLVDLVRTSTHQRAKWERVFFDIRGKQEQPLDLESALLRRAQKAQREFEKTACNTVFSFLAIRGYPLDKTLADIDPVLATGRLKGLLKDAMDGGSFSMFRKHDALTCRIRLLLSKRDHDILTLLNYPEEVSRQILPCGKWTSIEYSLAMVSDRFDCYKLTFSLVQSNESLPA